MLSVGEVSEELAAERNPRTLNKYIKFHKKAMSGFKVARLK